MVTPPMSVEFSFSGIKFWGLGITSLRGEPTKAENGKGAKGLVTMCKIVLSTVKGDDFS